MLKRTLCLMVLLVSCRETGPNHPSQPVADNRTAPVMSPDPSAAPSPQWIWGPGEAKAGEDRNFRVTFDAKLPAKANIGDPIAASLWGGLRR